VTTDEPGTGPGPEEADSLGSLGVPRARAPWERKDPADNEVKHSALVGFMSVPVSRRLPIRRSTFLMVVAFAGFATLLYFNPPVNDSIKGGAVVNGYYVPGAVPVSTTTTTTTVPPTTTTTVPPSSTTTTVPSRSTTTTSTSPSTSTTTTVPRGGTSGGGATTTTSTTAPFGGPTSGATGGGATGTTTSSTTK
jgi:hypothetical protein